MAKLYLQNLPTQEEVHARVAGLHPDVDVKPLYTNMLFMKVAAELETHFDDLLSNYGLSSGRFTLLILLRNHPEGLKPSELALQLGVTQATISGLLNNLEKLELVSRQTHQTDGRAFVIKLTQKGHEIIQEIFPKWYPRLAAFWAVINGDEKENINGLLGRMIENTAVLNQK
ncbi:Transcriptional repressor MprA [compost metagenome]